MSRFKYIHTPRRRPGPERAGLLRFALSPVVLVPGLLLAVLGGWWVTSSGGGGAPKSEQAVLSATCTPGEECASATPTAAPGAGKETPRPRSRAAPGGADDDSTLITGYAAVVLEEPCGRTLFTRNEHLSVPPASLTKIMTALVAVDHTDPDEMVRIDVNGPELSLETDSTVMGIEPGMRLSMRDLLYGLLLPSGNDAAIQIAEHVGGTVTEFVQMMNEKADELGLTDTHFANPHGLDDENLYSSAYDVAVMGRELMKDPFLAEIVRTRTYQPAWDYPPVENVNLLLGFYPGALGIKTGYTDLAGQTIVAAAERSGRRFIVAVMGAKTEIYGDASGLLDWAFTTTDSACVGSRVKR